MCGNGLRAGTSSLSCLKSALTQDSDTHEVMGLISEAGLYKLVFASEAPKANSFKAWIQDVAIPGFVTMMADMEMLVRN